MSELWGLRGRLTLALVAVSALTLAVTALLLLIPLDRKLRDDVRRSMVETARTARPGLTRLAPASLRAGSPQLRRTARELRRRTGLEVSLFDAAGGLLATTDPDPSSVYPEVRLALARDRLVARFGRGDGRAQSQVAMPVRAHGRPFAVDFRKSIEDLNGAQAVVQRSLVAAALVALGVAMVAGIALATGLVRRLTALRDVALRVAERGPGEPLAPDRGRDEVGDLSRAFATMQHRLDDQERARRAFVSTASHELRTPLTSLRLMLDGIDSELAAPEPDLGEVREQTDRALGQTLRLGRLAEELLDLSRLDAGVELRSEPVELVELTRSVLAEFAVRAGHTEERLELVAAEPVAWASGDPGAVARIVRILVDNALRHTPEEGAVQVRVEPRDGAPSIAVCDTGPGVPAADAERIFRRFERGPSTREDGGFGLGLAIGRELARRMGGDLRLLGPGPGATFVATFTPQDGAA